MSSVLDYLVENKDELTEDVEIKIGGRLSNQVFKIRRLNMEDFTMYQKKCTKTIGKGRKATQDFDGVKFNILLTVNQCVEPNFKDSALIKKLGVQTPEQAVDRLLMAGEIVDISQKIVEASGFDTDVDEEVQDIKN